MSNLSTLAATQAGEGHASKIVSWVRSHPWTMLAAIVLAGHAPSFLLRHSSEWDQVYLVAAERMIHGGDVYRYVDGYAYPPFMAWLAIPFTFMVPGMSRFLWFALNVVCFIFIFRWAWHLSGGGTLEGPRARDKTEHLICFLGLALAHRYALNGISHQQTDLVIGVLLMGGCLALARGRPLLAATGFGLAAAMKCTPLLWSAYLLWRRQWRAAIWLVLVAVGVNLLPNVVRAPDAGGLWLSEWLNRYIKPLGEKNNYPGSWGSALIYNQSISGAGQRWLAHTWSWHNGKFAMEARPDRWSPGAVKLAVYGTEALLILGVIGLLVRRRLARPTSDDSGFGEPTAHLSKAEMGEILEYGMVLALMVLLSPMSSKPHFLTLILPAFCLARLTVFSGRRILWLVMAVGLFLAVASLTIYGSEIPCVVLWCGSEMWNALLLLLGSGLALVMFGGLYHTLIRQAR
jgi:hypothetical protein